MPDLTTQNFTTTAGAQFHLYAFTVPANSTYQFQVSVVPHDWVVTLPGLRDNTRVDVWPGQDVPADALRLYTQSTLRFPSVDSQFVSFRNYSGNAVLVYLFALGDNERLSGNFWSGPGTSETLVVPLVTAGAVPASSTAAWLVPTQGYEWAYIEVAATTTYTTTAVGKNNTSAQNYFTITSDSGTIVTRANNAANAGISFRVRTTGMDQVGVWFQNTDAGSASSVTARVVLLHA